MVFYRRKLNFKKKVAQHLSKSTFCVRISFARWRRIEVVITSATRNRVVTQVARGFESHRLRQTRYAL